MSDTTFHSRSATAPSGARIATVVGFPLRLALAAINQLSIWNERAKQRRELSAMSDWMLRDIGLSRADIEAEADKPFWRA